jgi:hypothetical protein
MMNSLLFQRLDGPSLAQVPRSWQHQWSVACAMEHELQPRTANHGTDQGQSSERFAKCILRLYDVCRAGLFSTVQRLGISPLPRGGPLSGSAADFLRYDFQRKFEAKLSVCAH